MAAEAQSRSRATRFQEIVQILIQGDVWSMIREMGDGRPRAGNQPPAPERLRLVLEALGPTSIKLGQLLATRPDLMPAAYVEELKRLYDTTPPTPFEDVRAVVEAEAGRPLEEVFATFATRPIASASIGQVHRATLVDGTPVAVKVQHPGIEEAMRLDFEILRGLLRFMERTFAATRVWRPLDHLEELHAMLERELDYTHEMENTVRVRENFRGDPTVVVPKMFRPLCSRRILVMEYIQGIRFVDAKAMLGIDTPRVAKLITHAMARQIFVHRLFHADPSPGNLLILGSDRIAFLDFGAVGVVGARRARSILAFLAGVARSDPEATAEAVLELCEQREEIDQRRFLADVERMLAHFERDGVSVADPRLLQLVMELARDHRMSLPPDFILINRALFQFEGFCRELDPAFDLVAVLEPFVVQTLRQEGASPARQKEALDELLGSTYRLARAMPGSLHRIMRKWERNEAQVRIEIAGLEGYKSAQGRGVLKLSFSILMASLVIGLGLLYAGPVPEERVAPFLFGAGAIVAVWTLVMILWSEAFKGNRD